MKHMDNFYPVLCVYDLTLSTVKFIVNLTGNIFRYKVINSKVVRIKYFWFREVKTNRHQTLEVLCFKSKY